MLALLLGIKRSLSALIHAATMVAAGTVVLAGLFPLLSVSQTPRWVLGIAVSLTMFLTTILIFLTMREVWGWSLWLAVAVAGLFGSEVAIAGADTTFNTALTSFTGFLEGSGGKIITVLSLAGGLIGLASGRFTLAQIAVPVGVGIGVGSERGGGGGIGQCRGRGCGH